jgi:hypothetical protein
MTDGIIGGFFMGMGATLGYFVMKLILGLFGAHV